ncbi:MAG: hypothetical protein NXH97_05745 [Rhodobacteraceae bacterium]|nr:hypothetical protein [Paracoccaceae bacterium]
MALTWQEQLPGCFGVVDKTFALHPLDHGRALSLLNALVDENVSWPKVEEEATTFLVNADVSDDHAAEQLRTMKRMIEPWLDSIC